LSLPVKNRVSSENFILFKNGLIGEKLTIVVSKKVAPLAVDRNRVKRLIKEALRQMAMDSSSLKIIVKKNIADAKMAQVKDELTTMLSS